eukprot:6200863-Pleurochrysis_carterae.AAC.1
MKIILERQMRARYLAFAKRRGGSSGRGKVRELNVAAKTSSNAQSRQTEQTEMQIGSATHKTSLEKSQLHRLPRKSRRSVSPVKRAFTRTSAAPSARRVVKPSCSLCRCKLCQRPRQNQRSQSR